MSKVKNENYITIQGWMVNELKLKGNELLIYSLIFGFSQDGEQFFNGSLQYICDWTNSTKSGVLKALKKLVEKGLVEKKDIVINGVKFCEYRTTKFNTGMQQSLIGCTTKFNTGMQQSLTNNIKDINSDNIDKYSVPFEAFWKEYPRKKEKSKAYKCYQTRLKDGWTEEQLLTACKNYAQYCKDNRTEERYIKLCSTFLGPNTPFTDYFEPQKKQTMVKKTSFSNFHERDYDMEDLERRLLRG